MTFTRTSEGILEGGGRVIFPVLSEEDDYLDQEVTLDEILAAEDSDECQLFDEKTPARKYCETEIMGQGLEPGLILHGVSQDWFSIQPEYYGTVEGGRSKPYIGAPKIYVDYGDYRDKRENPMFEIEYDGSSDITLMVADGEYYDPDEQRYRIQWRRSTDLADMVLKKVPCKKCDKYPHGYALVIDKTQAFIAKDRHSSELAEYPWGVNPIIDEELRRLTKEANEQVEIEELKAQELMSKFAG